MDPDSTLDPDPKKIPIFFQFYNILILIVVFISQPDPFSHFTIRTRIRPNDTDPTRSISTTLPIILCLASLISGLGSRSRSRSEPGVFGSLEPEPLEKKTRSRSRLEKKPGARAAKKLACSSALREDKKHKEIVLYLPFFS